MGNTTRGYSKVLSETIHLSNFDFLNYSHSKVSPFEEIAEFSLEVKTK